MLSHDEDRRLKAIEQYLEESDPALCRMLRDHEPPSRRRRRRVTRIGVDVLGGLLFVLGAAAAAAVLMVLGVLVLTVGACLHVMAQD